MVLLNSHEHWWVLVTVVGGSGMEVVCCRLSLMMVLVGVVVVVVEERNSRGIKVGTGPCQIDQMILLEFQTEFKFHQNCSRNEPEWNC